LLALGLNLISASSTVTWICYAELVMIGMYGMYYLVQVFGLPYYVAAPFTILLVAGLGALLHLLVIAPLLSAPPINQLLATGACCSCCKASPPSRSASTSATSAFGCRCCSSPKMHLSYSRLLAFSAALIGMVLVYLFMTRTYVGTAIRAISQDRQIMR